MMRDTRKKLLTATAQEVRATRKSGARLAYRLRHRRTVHVPPFVVVYEASDAPSVSSSQFIGRVLVSRKHHFESLAGTGGFPVEIRVRE